jgi:hypothetical protein
MATRVVGPPTHQLFFSLRSVQGPGDPRSSRGPFGESQKRNVQIPVKKVRYAVVGFGHVAQAIHVLAKNRWSQIVKRLFVKRRSEQ